MSSLCNSTLIVAYGSTKGKARGYAQQIARKYNVSAVEMNSIAVDQILVAQTILFIVSTWGKGVFPENSASFFKNLQEWPKTKNENNRNKCDIMSGVNFAVLGLGSSKHKLYDQAGRDLFKEMADRGARPLCPLYEVDARSVDHGENQFIRWMRELEANLPLPDTYKQEDIEKRFKLTEIASNSSNLNNFEPPKGFSYSKIISYRHLTAPNVVPMVHEYILEIPKDFSYQASDHFDILPKNDPDAVAKVLEALSLNPDSIYQIDDTNQTSILPNKISIKELFSQYIDLSGLPTQFMINSFLLASSGEGKARLEKLHEPETLFPYLQNTSVAEFIIEFAPYGVPSLAALISSCPHIMPRTYSAASTLTEEFQNKLKLIVHDVTFGKAREGLCTRFLRNAAEMQSNCINDQNNATFNNNNFVDETKIKYIDDSNNNNNNNNNHNNDVVNIKDNVVNDNDGNCYQCSCEVNGSCLIPIQFVKGLFEEEDVPMILCAIGVGIAPILSLIDHRRDRGYRSPAILLFGSRHQADVRPFVEELRQLKGKALDDVLLAFSRDHEETGKKYYITNLIEDNKELVWKYWQDPKTAVYYCGPPKGIPENIKDILENIIVEKTGVTPSAAAKTCKQHKWYIEAF